MNVVAQVAAGVAAGIHVLVFVWETLLFRRPAVHRGEFKVPAEDVEPVRLWSFNVGLHNLFPGSGTVLGLIALNTGHEPVGRAPVFHTCGFMVPAGIGLAVSDRLAMSRPKGAGIGGSIAQITPALVDRRPRPHLTAPRPPRAPGPRAGAVRTGPDRTIDSVPVSVSLT